MAFAPDMTHPRSCRGPLLFGRPRPLIDFRCLWPPRPGASPSRGIVHVFLEFGSTLDPDVVEWRGLAKESARLSVP